jgi:uncharacterized membrane protein YqiK
VPINCVGVAQVKISSRDPASLKNAATHFLGKNDNQIKEIALSTMEGHQRSIMGKRICFVNLVEKSKFALRIL